MACWRGTTISQAPVCNTAAALLAAGVDAHDPALQRALVNEDAATETANWLIGLTDQLLSEAPKDTGDLHDVVHPIRA